MKGSFTFNEEKHEYALDGMVLPSVTQIVSAVIPRSHNADEWYLRRGTMIHRSAAMMLRGILDWQSVDPRICGHVKAAERAVNDLFGGPSEDMIIERPDYHKIMLYAGTPDLIHKGQLWDWKCSAEPENAFQLGAYCAIAEQRGINIKSCAAVELHDDGTYRIDTYKPARCKSLFMACYSLYGWMKENNRIKEKENDSGQ